MIRRGAKSWKKKLKEVFMSSKKAFGRVLLKLSGEALSSIMINIRDD